MKEKVPILAATQIPLLVLGVILAYRRRVQAIRRKEYEQRLAAVTCGEIYGGGRMEKSFEAFEPVIEPMTPELQEWAEKHGLEVDP